MIEGLTTMIITTGPSVEGRTISQYCGLVNGEAILGANIFKDFFASIRDIVGGRSGAYETSLQQARTTAIREMEQAARALGADAIIAVDIDYESIAISNGGTMLMVAASGTAVRLA